MSSCIHVRLVNELKNNPIKRRKNNTDILDFQTESGHAKFQTAHSNFTNQFTVHLQDIFKIMFVHSLQLKLTEVQTSKLRQSFNLPVQYVKVGMVVYFLLELV